MLNAIELRWIILILSGLPKPLPEKFGGHGGQDSIFGRIAASGSLLFELCRLCAAMMSLTKLTAYVLGLLAPVVLAGRLANAQHARGELRIEVRDPQGAAVPTKAELVSDAKQFRRTFQVGADGPYVIQDLPFGVYRLSVNTEGFAPWSGLVEVRSEVPVRVSVSLGLAAVATQVHVSDSATLVDSSETGAVYRVGRQTLGETIPAQPEKEA
jgi:hypothetical protein